MHPRFLAAMAAYAILALITSFWIDGILRNTIWLLLAALALKTFIAYKAGW